MSCPCMILKPPPPTAPPPPPGVCGKIVSHRTSLSGATKVGDRCFEPLRIVHSRCKAGHVSDRKTAPAPSGSTSQTQDERPSCNCVWVPMGRLDMLTVWESLVSPLTHQPSVLWSGPGGGPGQHCWALWPWFGPPKVMAPVSAGTAGQRPGRWPRSGQLLPPSRGSHHRDP